MQKFSQLKEEPKQKKTLKMLLRGFTLIELLVVITIIAMVAAVVVALISTQPRAKGRDARREVDMKQVRNGLSLYVDSFGVYPCAGASLVAIDGSSDCVSSALSSNDFMSALPLDPLNAGVCSDVGNNTSSSFKYCYEASTLGTSYTLYYRLETDSIKPRGWQAITP